MAEKFVNKPLQATKSKSPCITINPGLPAEHKKTVVVLGVERGGTSMGAAVIRAIGINMGDSAGLNHEDPGFLSEDTKVLKQQIVKRNKDNAVWGFKVPKASLFLPFYEKNLRNPYYVVVYRNIAATVDSWQMRKTGTPLDTMEHTLNYYSHIQTHLRATNRPAILVNYERAVIDKENTVVALANFLGQEADPALIERGASMMTGDGQGYVNLPEHFFKVTPSPGMPERGTISVTSNLQEIQDSDSWVSFPSLNRKLVFTPDGNEHFPKNFWIRIKLEGEDSLDFASHPLRVYFNYTGKMFPGHCSRPKICRDINYLFVETNGKAKAIAFGPLHEGTRFKIEPQFFAASDDDGKDLEEVDDSVFPTAAKPKASLLRRLFGD